METIAELRKKAGMTQAELAIRISVSQMAVSHWESGRRRPGLEALVKLGDLFDMRPCDVFNTIIQQFPPR